MTDESWRHLLPYGYAPGNYMGNCRVCGKLTYDIDKYARSCKPCAEQRYKEYQNEQNQPK